jgi:hypothetical protein
MNMKVAQDVAISLGYFSDSKKSERASKSSPISKKLPNRVTLLSTVAF